MTNTQNKQPFITETEPGVFFVKLKKVYYEQEAVMQASYKFTKSCFIKIDAVEDGYVGIWFKAKPQFNIDPELLLCEYCNEVLDQQVRLDLEKRYGTIRDNIYQFAFGPIKDRMDDIDE
ncbi:His-Xaa-Ser system protein HxsD [Sporomusa acidovorans]|uniref:His-Xaa-Ser system protein HxsD n=1 Tax=Sporomusa acidovorans TaxID=112900 RepID=UPI000B84E516|nr:His-Xaa-Ser system protein HxsD [Sporomusa acidovorans]